MYKFISYLEDCLQEDRMRCPLLGYAVAEAMNRTLGDLGGVDGMDYSEFAGLTEGDLGKQMRAEIGTDSLACVQIAIFMEDYLGKKGIDLSIPDSEMEGDLSIIDFARMVHKVARESLPCGKTD